MECEADDSNPRQTYSLYDGKKAALERHVNVQRGEDVSLEEKNSD